MKFFFPSVTVGLPSLVKPAFFGVGVLDNLRERLASLATPVSAY